MEILVNRHTTFVSARKLCCWSRAYICIINNTKILFYATYESRAHMPTFLFGFRRSQVQVVVALHNTILISHGAWYYTLYYIMHAVIYACIGSKTITIIRRTTTTTSEYTVHTLTWLMGRSTLAPELVPSSTVYICIYIYVIICIHIIMWYTRI